MHQSKCQWPMWHLPQRAIHYCSLYWKDHTHQGPISLTNCELIIQLLMLVFTGKIMIRSGHNFAHVMTAELSWHVQICGLISSLESWWKQREFSLYFNDQLTNSLWNDPLKHNVIERLNKKQVTGNSMKKEPCCSFHSWGEVSNLENWWSAEENNFQLMYINKINSKLQIRSKFQIDIML